MENKWAGLSPDEKQAERFKQWLSPDNIEFISPEAERLYKERVNRLIDAIKLREPDRVPLAANPGHTPARYSGYTVRDVMYDINKVVKAWKKYIDDFELDILPSAGVIRCGRVLDIINSRMYKWPGHGLSDDLAAQYLEGEYVRADEWDIIRKDPADFHFRTYLPRICGVAEALKKLPPLTAIGAAPGGGFAAFADPEIQAVFRAFFEAGEEEKKWRGVISQLDREGLASGLPIFYGGTAGAISPLDRIGASLRGTKGTVMDMFRQPDKLFEYMEEMIPAVIRAAVAGAERTGVPIIFIPLHRGADGFMSEAQFNTFYWPYLKRVILGIVEEGLVPRLFAEGGYNSRLEIISELPKGKVVWHFDHTDMARAKEILGGRACIMGNIPASLLVTGTRDEVREYCRKLIETAGKDGGYIMAPGATADNANLENIKVMMESVKEYGVYRK
ncbi:MAG: hypothetical protein JW882_08580 [Deltaproteobacteria bacterium]|nr:hypothetical protein [Deltaproteobacteria bacterium]